MTRKHGHGNISGPQGANSPALGCVAPKREHQAGQVGAHPTDVGGKRGQHPCGAGGISPFPQAEHTGAEVGRRSSEAPGARMRTPSSGEERREHPKASALL